MKNKKVNLFREEAISLLVLFTLLWVAIWSLVWSLVGFIDNGYCKSKGYEYSHTTVSLDGYCKRGEVEIKATKVAELSHRERPQ